MPLTLQKGRAVLHSHITRKFHTELPRYVREQGSFPGYSDRYDTPYHAVLDDKTLLGLLPYGGSLMIQLGQNHPLKVFCGGYSSDMVFIPARTGTKLSAYVSPITGGINNGSTWRITAELVDWDIGNGTATIEHQITTGDYVPGGGSEPTTVVQDMQTTTAPVMGVAWAGANSYPLAVRHSGGLDPLPHGAVAHVKRVRTSAIWDRLKGIANEFQGDPLYGTTASERLQKAYGVLELAGEWVPSVTIDNLYDGSICTGTAFDLLTKFRQNSDFVVNPGGGEYQEHRLVTLAMDIPSVGQIQWMPTTHRLPPNLRARLLPWMNTSYSSDPATVQERADEHVSYSSIGSPVVPAQEDFPEKTDVYQPSEGEVQAHYSASNPLQYSGGVRIINGGYNSVFEPGGGFAGENRPGMKPGRYRWVNFPTRLNAADLAVGLTTAMTEAQLDTPVEVLAHHHGEESGEANEE